MFDRKKWCKENKERNKAVSKLYREKNKDSINKKCKDWHKANPNYNKDWLSNNQQHIKEYRVKNKQKNREYLKLPLPKLHETMRSNVRRILRLTGKRKSIKSIQYFGCTVQELKLHLEKLFKPGMSWDNHGKWHIDHIKPISSFTEETIMQANHYSNLQPLWAAENLSKGAKII